MLWTAGARRKQGKAYPVVMRTFSGGRVIASEGISLDLVGDKETREKSRAAPPQSREENGALLRGSNHGSPQAGGVTNLLLLFILGSPCSNPWPGLRGGAIS
jgi:hypothetical protein